MNGEVVTAKLKEGGRERRLVSERVVERTATVLREEDDGRGGAEGSYLTVSEGLTVNQREKESRRVLLVSVKK
jgi:hypothetical protein